MAFPHSETKELQSTEDTNHGSCYKEPSVFLKEERHFMWMFPVEGQPTSYSLIDN